MAEDGYKVSLHVYDLSQGLARQLSTTLLGKVIEGIWHTGLVVYGNEYYFGGGIQHDPVGNTPYGTPVKVVDLGITHVPKELFEEYLEEISPRYTAQTYNLLQHNCNNFSNEVAQFLVGVAIPDYILNLPNEVMSSPMGAMMLPMIQQLETTLRQNAVPQPPQFRPKVNAQPQQPKATSSAPNASSNCNAEGKPDTCTARESPHSSVPPTLKPAESQEEKNSGGAVADPLRDARGRVHEEIAKEFAAIMATGTLQASEAAVLAARRVMERHGRMNAAPLTQG